jgi:Type I site-specific restriction-modification system, R (restriction) subunit and related helicases
MNESQTRLTKIDPKLKANGWGTTADSYILTEVPITRGRISQTIKPRPMKADYILQYKGVKLAVVEAKSDEKPVGEGVMQAKEYAEKLKIRFTYATNGDAIYQIDMETGEEGEVEDFLSPEEIWKLTFGDVDEWRDKFNAQPLYNDGQKVPRYYQEIAINKVLDAVAAGKKRILLTMATGTGKTFISFQIAYKLFHTRWNVKKTGNRPRILFLADRNILANQAFNGFFGFSNDALSRITPEEVRKNGKVPTNASIFFTIFQTFDSGEEGKRNFGQYPRDFFDFVIIDECHRGGANDESRWRGIMEYFDSAVQLGMTATPRRDTNANTYEYFGKPVYEYSLKEGIADGYLTPFRHCKMQSNIDDYIYTPEDEVLSGEVEEGKVYTEKDFYQGNIKIKQRDEARVQEFLKYIGENEKTLVFCATQDHAAQIRDMINKFHHGNPQYAVRVTANDGVLGEKYLKDFQDNERTIPTILTTSQKLSTGVDALNVRNIVLLRPIHSMIEFKQIIGRGTRLYDGKYYFTIYDFVKAYENFQDPAWDGEEDVDDDPIVDGYEHRDDDWFDRLEDPDRKYRSRKKKDEDEEVEQSEKLEIRLSAGHTMSIKHIKSDMFWGPDGVPVSAEDFLRMMFGKLPEFFADEAELREKWSSPITRRELLNKMAEQGYGEDVLKQIRSLIDAEDCDLLDVLEYIAYQKRPVNRSLRAQSANLYTGQQTPEQVSFIQYLVSVYVKAGIDELDADRLPKLMANKYGTILEGTNALGGIEEAKLTFYGFQRRLYEQAI